MISLRRQQTLPSIAASSLGATLYVPATRADLFEVASGQRYPDLRSVVICLEDSVSPAQVGLALANLSRLLRRLDCVTRPWLFVRPRDATMFSLILEMDRSDVIDGFVVPKATSASLPAYLEAVADRHHYLLPTLETRDAFDPTAMHRLRDELIPVAERILIVRIGGNDLLKCLGVRRSPLRTAYDGPLGPTIAMLVGAFIPWGFAMSAPVLENYGDIGLLAAEVERDLEHGLLSKTAIHPCQILPMHACYQVEAAEYENALAILAEDAAAVFAVRGVMLEPATHGSWAHSIVSRAQEFGVRPGAKPLTLVG